MNTTISDKEYDAAIAAANKAATDPYVYVHKLIQPFEYLLNSFFVRHSSPSNSL